MIRRHEMERDVLSRNVETTTTELAGHHAREADEYWSRHHQEQSKTNTPSLLPPQAPITGAEMANSSPSATTATATGQKPLPKLPPKLLPAKKQDAQKAPLVSTDQQRAKQVPKQASVSRRVQKHTRKDASGVSKLSKLKQSAATLQKKARPTNDVKTIDLSVSDDEQLIEISKADSQKEPGLTVTPAPTCPSIPYASLELFGGDFQDQAVSFH